jgi:hypothetical protein
VSAASTDPEPNKHPSIFRVASIEAGSLSGNLPILGASSPTVGIRFQLNEIISLLKLDVTKPSRLMKKES